MITHLRVKVRTIGDHSVLEIIHEIEKLLSRRGDVSVFKVMEV